MKKRIIHYFILAFSYSFIIGCRTTTFLPQSHNVPLFTDKNQLYVNTSFSSKTLDFQTAYSPIKNMGVMINGQLGQSYIMPEIGLGGYYSFNKTLIAELYGGGGKSKMDFIKTSHSFYLLSYTDRKEYDVNFDATKIFLQANLGAKFNDKINLSFSLKTSYWYFSNYYYHYEWWKFDSGSGNHQTLAEKDSINVKNESQITIEPAITLQTGGKYAKYMLQTGVNFSSYGNLNPYNQNPFFIRLGVSVNIDFASFGKE